MERVRLMLFPALLAAFLLGIVAGLRTFTAPAVLWLLRHRSGWATLLAVLAFAEYAGDLYPKAAPRTGLFPLIVRMASGAFVGSAIAVTAGTSAVAGAIAGVAGAVVGAYGGLALRLRAIAAIGPVASGVLEDVVAIAIAVTVVLHLPA